MMLNYNLFEEMDLYKIKVNKKGYNNNSIKRRKNNSNSEEKMGKINLHIKCIEEENTPHKEGNILDDLLNNKYLKPILESQDIDEKLLNCNLKEPVKNNFNVSLNDFFNRRKKYYKIDMNMNHLRGLSIKIHNISNSNNSDYYNKNDLFGSRLVHNKTMENNGSDYNINQNIDINSGYNNNINNYYNDIQMTNNYYNNYNNNGINILNPPLNNLCTSLVRKKIRKYFSNYNSNERNNPINKISSPNLHFFTSQTNYNRIIRNNKEINIINNTNEVLDNDINKKYNDIKNIIKNNNKYDYSKKLFDIYRGKLIKIFLGHIQTAVIKYISNIFKFFTDQMRLNDKKHLKKIDEIFIPKIKLKKTNKDIIKKSANFIPYLQVFNSDKKTYRRYTNNNAKITQYKRYRNKSNINNNAIINKRIIEKNKTNRNSFVTSNGKNNDSNIRIVKLNTNNSNSLIYKKKKPDKNNICVKKNKNDLLNNSKGKIIDIDINLGKPIKEISDINPLESGFFMNDNYNLRNINRSSLSTTKREKRKIKNKSKNKKLSLPKKKYLEEKYDNTSSETENINNSFDKNIINNNFTIKNNNNLIQPFLIKSSRINNYNIIKLNQINPKKKENNILITNIVTADKRLFININYISNDLFENNLGKKIMYENNSLIVKRNSNFPIFGQNSMKNINFSNNYKNKYLNSCVKFIVRNINKVFLKKAFKYFLKECQNKFKKNKIGENNIGKKYKINTYKRKIGKNKI